MAVSFNLGSTSQVTVANGDQVTLVSGATIRSSTDGVNLASGPVRTEFRNLGTVLSGNEAVEILAEQSIVVNHGIIESSQDGIDLSSTVNGALHRIVNYGTISAAQEPIDSDATGVFDLFVTNYGTMVSALGLPIIFDDGDMRNIVVFNSGDMQGGELGMSGTDSARLTNTGTIVATFVDAASASSARVFNSGQIICAVGDIGTVVLLTGDADDIVTNSGRIVGGVDLNAGADIYRATENGLATSVVEGGIGNDTLIGATGNDRLNGDSDNDLVVGNEGNDTLAGGSGDDRVIGGGGDDSLNGGDNNDTLNGGAGDDILEGENGNDLLLGAQGVDFLVGATGNDTLDGGEGDDSLFGGADADVLRGRGGIDYIDGGLGRDVLEGGPDADLFIFNNVLDSTPDANRDVILDFEKGIDTINVVNVVPGAFVFRGTSAFTSTGAAELRLFETPDGSTIVQMDTNGDGISDMQIRTAGVTGLASGDFDL